MRLIKYLAGAPNGSLILWSYVIWYVVMAAFYFDSSASLWITSLGISIIVGYALLLSTGPVSKERIENKFWESFRLFACPFLVSSFSSLVKGHGFLLVLSPVLLETFLALGAILMFWVLIGLCRVTTRTSLN